MQYMPIKHLVLPGGGAAAIRLLGALQKLHDNEIWNVKDIESIHAVSAGTIIGVLIALKFDIETIVDYIIQRPWGDVFKVSLTNIFDVFLKKGFFSSEMFVTFVKPFFDTKDISLDITLKDFYEITNVKLYFYTVELNSFQLTQVSHETFPDLQVIKAVHMSAAYPVMVSPVIIDDKCYVDGGVICNYPINYCTNMCPDKNEILGIGSEVKATTKCITNESSIFEYLMELIYKMVRNIFGRVKDIENRQPVPNYVSIHIPSVTIGDIQDTFNDIELRKALLAEGAASAEDFLEDDTDCSSSVSDLSSSDLQVCCGENNEGDENNSHKTSNLSYDDGENKVVSTTSGDQEKEETSCSIKNSGSVTSFQSDMMPIY
jgi:predicted acylesterase/phospholipase RssA